jgi:Protein of unknown function (DUF2029).
VRSSRWARPLYVGFTVLGAAICIGFVVVHDKVAIDAHAYFVADLDHLYAKEFGTTDAYHYSPVFAQVLEPLRWLGWDVFRDGWRLVEAGIVVGLTGPLSGLLVLSNPIALEVAAGNVHLLIAAALVAGFRWPAAWSFILLTKVTPGIGLLWFATRREWRSLGIALAATAVIAGISFSANPGAWVEWVRLLIVGLGGVNKPDAIAISVPLVLRLAAAAALTILAARTNRRWILPIAVLLAMPTVFLTSLSVLVAIPALLRSGQERLREQANPAADGIVSR